MAAAMTQFLTSKYMPPQVLYPVRTPFPCPPSHAQGIVAASFGNRPLLKQRLLTQPAIPGILRVWAPGTPNRRRMRHAGRELTCSRAIARPFDGASTSRREAGVMDGGGVGGGPSLVMLEGREG